MTRHGMVYLSESVAPVSPPEVEGQISAPETDHIIQFFQENYLPIYRKIGINPDTARILELGSGFGALSYGTLKSTTPHTYVATDFFPTLATQLSENLMKWKSQSTTVYAALLNPADPLLFGANEFYVIQSHSVLHHVLDYRSAIVSLYRKLATPGAIIVAEPSADGYGVLAILIKTILLLASRKVYEFSGSFLDTLRRVEQNLSARMKHHDDLAFMKQYGDGDKHIFSIFDFLTLAEELGARLHIQREFRGLPEVARFELMARGATDNDIMLTKKVLADILPSGSEHTLFSDMRIIVALLKTSP